MAKMTKETLAKAKATKASGVKQLAPQDEQETQLLIDYEAKTLTIYSNRATVINRIDRLGYVGQATNFQGEIYSKTYVLSSSEIGKFMRTGIFQI